MQSNTIPTSYLWKIGAPAGLGVMTTGLSMSKLAMRSGQFVYDYAEYPSLIKGGHNTYECHISTIPVTSSRSHIDCLICFNAETATLHEKRLDATSLIVFDPSQFTPSNSGTPIALPMNDLLAELQADKVMINMIALGASCALLGGSLDSLTALISEQFASKKGSDIADKNSACAAAGYSYVTTHHSQYIRQILAIPATTDKQVLLAGNDAFALGAVAADCKLYAAYPMSPSSSVLATLASWQRQTGMIVRHAEDEIGVVNEALGASFMGVRAATGTSGGGFALMTETISYAGVAELPLVIFVAQRPGPATGMPTWTEQGDLLFASFAGHGEFPKIVLAPGDPEEMVNLTQEAFDLADIYQLPVVVLSDKNLSESHFTFPLSRIETILSRAPQRGEIVREVTAEYQRYVATPNGISPRVLPGTAGTFFQANSYEHLADSHTTEDAEVRIEQVRKREQKIKTYFSAHYPAPNIEGDLDSAAAVLISWGGTKGAIRATQQELARRGTIVAHIHFSHVHPLNPDVLKPLLSHTLPYILIENNMSAQFGQLLRMATGFIPTHTITRFDGRPFCDTELAQEVTDLLNK